MLILIIAYICLLQPAKKRARTDFSIFDNDFSWIFHVESTECLNEELAIIGWAYAYGRDSSTKSFDVVLHNLETNEYVLPKVEYLDRKDVNAYYSCEHDYTHSGFVARIPLNEFEEEEQVYEILIRPNGSKAAYRSDSYLFKNELYSTNPQKYVALDTEGTRLDEIVKNGILHLYRPDIGIYVYRYLGNLYWIADENFMFEDDGSTYIEYQLWTTQNDKLPQHRLEHGWLFDNIGFMFETNEVHELNTEKYRVARAAIPTEYAICKIETGRYINQQWVWVKHFLPYPEWK